MEVELSLCDVGRLQAAVCDVRPVVTRGRVSAAEDGEWVDKTHLLPYILLTYH